MSRPKSTESLSSLVAQIPEELHDKVKAKASLDKTSQKDIVKAALDQYLGERPKREGLQGEIAINDKLIWEPSIHYAYAPVIVIAMKSQENDQFYLLQSTNILGKTDSSWQNEERIREACVRFEDFETGKWRTYHPVDLAEE